MPPIPIHTSSPINAAKAQGTTPKTANSEAQPVQAGSIRLTGPELSPTSAQPYPPAQPGARPAIPAPTSTAQASPPPPPPPTRTQQQNDTGPPPPQPGAVPTPPGSTKVPPPPRVGEIYQPPQPTPASTASVPFPAQMSMPPPTTSYSTRLGSGTSTNTPQLVRPVPVNLGSTSRNDYSHPPGYQQSVASDSFRNYQPSGHNASMGTAEQGSFMDEDDDGVWDTAKRWARTAGKNLAAAESEVWRKLNDK
ncbi:hypothetical protein SODALDRAFT_333150 [Sodiomyces alkalinus F11]|uniref:Uncharacterized protein n=1 Tax=Sodiomyces alkalinus (strain CBS 110278 / VKM F-3762 / F11) TaxID=1314773 RepID=A0A3N2PVN0_SODAK|nr:hypothetical protein SODALDRAFT_333150 [Sodiomyces alkalinus F11]ROT38551.1 hypothetical protein SODALDRAFT_333150 [Sodiomyces alkalinus F11]